MSRATARRPAAIDLVPPPLGPRDAGRPMTLDEFEEAEYELGHRYELIHGVLVVTPSPLEEERDANEELGYSLRYYRDTHPEGNRRNSLLESSPSRGRLANRERSAPSSALRRLESAIP